MGYMKHHAMVVTSFDEEKLATAHAMAEKLLPELVTPIIESRINGYQSFFIAPDGSKEAWEESDTGNEQRDQFIEWLNSQRYDDNSTPFEWVEFTYSGDDWDAGVSRHAWTGVEVSE